MPSASLQQMLNKGSTYDPDYIANYVSRKYNCPWPGTDSSVASEVDTMVITLEQNGYAVPTTARAKLHAIRSIIVSELPYTDWHIFEATACTLIDGFHNPTVEKPPLASELLLTFDIMSRYYDVKIVLSEEVKVYAGCVFKYRGIPVFPADYRFLDAYIYYNSEDPSKPLYPENYDKLRRIGDAYSGKSYVSSTRELETVEGVLKSRLSALQKLRKGFADNKYAYKSLYYLI